VLLEKMKDEVIALPRRARVSQRSAPRFLAVAAIALKMVA